MAFSFSELQKWVLEWESPAMEFKLSMPKDIGETICAFTNTAGGMIVFGVEETQEKVKSSKGLLSFLKPAPKEAAAGKGAKEKAQPSGKESQGSKIDLAEKEKPAAKEQHAEKDAQRHEKEKPAAKEQHAHKKQDDA